MPPYLEEIETLTMRERIAERIRQAILHGSLPLGMRIVEREMARQLGVSLTVVREALIRLEAEGFIVKQANATTHVVALSLEDVEKIFAVRRILEGYAVEEAAQKVSPAQVEEGQHLYLDILDAARAGDAARFIASDLRWHRGVWSFSGNEHLANSLERTVLPLFAFATIRVRGASRFDLLEDAQSHLPILEALKAGRPAAARATLEAALDGWLAQTKQWAFDQRATTEHTE